MRPDHFRVARPTASIESVLAFYRDGLGFEVIGSFQGHDGFDGVMLGDPKESYHLEFTAREGEAPPTAPTTEDLIVFYLPDPEDFRAAVERMRAHGHEPVVSSNPYWDANGVTFQDPDGYRVVLVARGWPTAMPKAEN